MIDEKKNAIDLSNHLDAVPLLFNQFARTRKSRNDSVKFLSMANCRLVKVPIIFNLTTHNERALSDDLEYVTFYGNNFQLSSSTGEDYDVFINVTEARQLKVAQRTQTSWTIGLKGVTFPKLKELDLRACSIKILEQRVFVGMPNLESLYLGENSITYIDANAFTGLKNLLHLDLSRNFAYDENDVLSSVVLEAMDLFKDMDRLQSLDFSYTKLTQRNSPILRSLSPTLQRLSLCYCSLSRFREEALRHTSIKFLDISGNLDILANPRALRGLEGTLKVLYAEEIGLNTMESFKNFRRLEILKLSNNEITAIPSHIGSSLRNLQVLDLDNNRVITWFEPTVVLMRNLRLLSLRENSINMISSEMANDIANVSYVGLSRNIIICNCNARDIYELVWRNGMYVADQLLDAISNNTSELRLNFHTGFKNYNQLIKNRQPIIRTCNGYNICDIHLELSVSGRILFFDYMPADYQCLLVTEGRSTGFENFPYCMQQPRDNSIYDYMTAEWNKLYLLIIPALLLPALTFLFVMRRNVKYFLITMRNSAMLSLINKNEIIDDAELFNYDVFVSYCNEDRGWVLDQLLPHVERDCNISVCLHERDFQVGLSILENIVSCMDRSRSIMLILSQRFLLSQWCQFEMHLAQHRLLETRREDLILILLEEIPRRLRPNTLHYLMLTKTYIVWPKTEVERTQFWKRLKKSLVTQKQKNTENVSLA